MCALPISHGYKTKINWCTWKYFVVCEILNQRSLKGWLMEELGNDPLCLWELTASPLPFRFWGEGFISGEAPIISYSFPSSCSMLQNKVTWVGDPMTQILIFMIRSHTDNSKPQCRWQSLFLQVCLKHRRRGGGIYRELGRVVRLPCFWDPVLLGTQLQPTWFQLKPQETEKTQN